ncbi:PREDICTED: uncharacterized protein LOC106815429 [Priapulus caudatus]|uniref:Uncharacterized protein LOC106815429 n=1 Tax=Priapulus caudatus TaxID=37621 RepID=A0ABM1ET53_PRICU|nr:PREDICTED: uncharacterized protein LOC106815429 [Priapulus caudatus]
MQRQARLSRSCKRISNFQRVRKSKFASKAKFEEFHQRLSDANHDLDVALDIDTNVRMQRIHDLHVNMKAQQEFSELVYVDFRENSLATDTLAGEEKTEMEDRVGRCQSANSRSDGTKRESYGTDAATAARGSTYPQTSRRSTGNACVDDCNCTVCLCCLKIRFKPKCCC